MNRFFINFLSLSTLLISLPSCSEDNKYIYKDWYVEKISLDHLWEVDNLQNAKKPIVAVIDSGFDDEYLRFLNNNVIRKYNVFDDSDEIQDYYGHGTIIAEIIGGKHDNSSKFYGVNPYCELILIKALNNQGLSNSVYLEKAVDYAVKNGADIINMSLGSKNNYFEFQSSIEKAISNNIFVVSAVGDSGENEIFYPSLYENVFPIGNQTTDGVIDKKSNTSLNKKTIPFPGEKIIYPIINGDTIVYKTNSGSSFSCAIFSGVLSLLISKYDNLTFSNLYGFFTDQNNYVDNFIDLKAFAKP